MNIAIIGGGVAGLAACNKLVTEGYNVTLIEKSIDHGNTGHGFALLPNGINALKELGMYNEVSKRGCFTTEFLMNTNTNKQLLRQNLDNHLTILRSELIDVLRKPIQNKIKYGLQLNSVSLDKNDQINKLNFNGGATLNTDLVIAADGANSYLQKILFKNRIKEDGLVNEIVCTIHAPKLANTINGTFLKTIKENGGLACGILNAGNNKIIFFCQYQKSKFDVDATNKTNLLKFIIDQFGDWADPIPQLISLIDVSKIYHWEISTTKLIGNIYSKNAILIGDAAHTFLPFTSQGANCALQDGTCFANHLTKAENNIDIAFKSYQSERARIYTYYYNEGKKLEAEFLNLNDSNVRIPMIQL